MSARVLNPAMMSEMGHRGIILAAGGGGNSSSSSNSSSGDGGARAAPTRAALARVRRDLFGPVDHAAARALAERELRAQSLLDAERWGFDFHLEIPRINSRYEWEPVTSREVVPEPYALRGMPYLRKHAPGPRRNLETTIDIETRAAAATRKRILSMTAMTTTTATTTTTMKNAEPNSPITSTTTPAAVARKAERTPPQEPRVPDNGETTLTTTMMSAMTATATATTTIITSSDDEFAEESCGRKKKCGNVPEEPTTPVLPIAARKQQSSITDFMKSRKRTLNGSTKSIVELPEKIARNAGQIRS